jgi:hypothetical protein
LYMYKPQDISSKHVKLHDKINLNYPVIQDVLLNKTGTFAPSGTLRHIPADPSGSPSV